MIASKKKYDKNPLYLCIFSKAETQRFKTDMTPEIIKKILLEFSCWTTKNLYLNFNSQLAAAEQKPLCSTVCCMAGCVMP